MGEKMTENANENKLEKFFVDICGKCGEIESPDFWPAVERSISEKKEAKRIFYRRTALAGAFSFAMIVTLSFFNPAFTQNALKSIKKLFKGFFSMSLSGSEISGIAIAENGEVKELKIDGNLVKVKMSKIYDKSVLIEIEVYKRDEEGRLKLFSKPKVVTMSGKPAEIRVGELGKSVYRFKITPEQIPETYKGKIVKTE